MGAESEHYYSFGLTVENSTMAFFFQRYYCRKLYNKFEYAYYFLIFFVGIHLAHIGEFPLIPPLAQTDALGRNSTLEEEEREDMEEEDH